MQHWIIRYWGESPRPVKEQSFYGDQATSETYADRELARLGGVRREILPDEEANRAMGIKP